jgi:RecA/RadA recombinase
VTEVAGPPGVGKTQACIQWSVAVQWPWQLGGLQGRAIYLDCDDGFFAERVADIAASQIRSALENHSGSFFPPFYRLKKILKCSQKEFISSSKQQCYNIYNLKPNALPSEMRTRDLLLWGRWQ